MNIEFTTSYNSQPLLAVFVNSSNYESILSSAPFSAAALEWAKDADFSGSNESTISLPKGALVDAGEVKSVLVVGSNDERKAAGTVGFHAKNKGFTGVTFFNPSNVELVLTQVLLGNYRYEIYKSKTKSSLENIALLTEANDAAKQKALSIATARNFARDLVNAPADDIYPESLAEIALEEIASENISVEVWGVEKMEEEEMVGIMAVGRGSSNPPRFIKMHYTPKDSNADTKKIVLVGKGVTFDAGGLSLKPSGGMQTMRCDMAGSAVVMGVFHALKELQPNVEVYGLIGAVENMCAADSYKLGDILTYKNGVNVEIHNTDAEGRLVLADCLIHGSQLKPDFMIDFATLTGACLIALGDNYSGLFSDHDDLVNDIMDSTNAVGELTWRLPLPKIYKSLLKGQWGDIKNVGGRAAGSITAALFLQHFVDDTTWAHVDIAGPAFLDKTFEHFASGGTGTMVESVLHLLEKHSN